MRLPPHITATLDALRGRRDIPSTLFEAFDELRQLDLNLPLHVRHARWEAAIDLLRANLRLINAGNEASADANRASPGPER